MAGRWWRFQSTAPAKQSTAFITTRHTSPTSTLIWAQESGMKLFLGNLEDPSIPPSKDGAGIRVYPSAFWLEPSWRDTRKFTIEWLRAKASVSDIVLLMHPDNVLADPSLVEDLKSLLSSLDTKLLQ